MKYMLIILALSSFSVFSQKRFIEDNTAIKNALKLRDPFKAPKSQQGQGELETKLKEGVFSNLLRPDAIALENVRVKGILMGKKRRVILTAGVGEKTPTYMLSEGSLIANGTVELKAILPSGVIFVEKVTNVYGQTEYLETVVPISK